MPFYHYSQNNSGGAFDYDENLGLTHHVVIEAADELEADARFEGIGGYFNGGEDGIDCECCGDRWYPTSSYYVADYPHIYSRELSHDAPVHLLSFMDVGREIAVHHASGDIEWFHAQ